ncbi:MAG: thiamine-phosphate kinase [Nitriliruptorales bacterium]|nr:thiamine-phosphate kinase [Nitriliruptorales bacterium]
MSRRWIFRSVFAASFSASCAACFQLSADTPSSSIEFNTATASLQFFATTASGCLSVSPLTLPPPAARAPRRFRPRIVDGHTEGMPSEGEFDLIARLAPFLATSGEDLVVGHGDDAAVIDVDGRGVCLAVDVLVEDVHFLRAVSSMSDVGYKSVAVNCSDLAAMGATPSVALVGLCRPTDVSSADIQQLYEGMSEACERWGLRLVGGDTVAAQALAVSVTVMGDVAPEGVVRRSGARPGDHLLVVGSLGAAAAGLALYRATGEFDDDLLIAHRRPVARVAAGRTLADGGATAMIDVSDGFGADLTHVCQASGVGAVVEATALPAADGVAAVAKRLEVDPYTYIAGGGDDYALLAAVPAPAAPALATATGGVVVGEVIAGPPSATLRLPDGSTVDMAGMGWDHYGEERA